VYRKLQETQFGHRIVMSHIQLDMIQEVWIFPAG